MNLLQRDARDSTAEDDNRAVLLHHAARLALAAALAIVTYLLFPAAPAVDFPLREVGAVAPENVIAPFAFRVPKQPPEMTKERDDVSRSVEPVFVYQRTGLDSARTKFRQFFGVLAAPPPAGRVNTAALMEARARELALELSAEEAAYLSAPARRQALESAIARAYDRWLAEGVAAAADVDAGGGTVRLLRGTDERAIPADSVLTLGALLARARLYHPDPGSAVADGLYAKLLSAFFHPTIVPDRAATARRRASVAAAVTPYKYEVREGEKIVGAHEVVGREEYEKMRTLRDELQRRRHAEWSPGRIAGSILFNLLLICVFGVTLVLFRPQLYDSMRALLLFAVVFALVLGVSAIVANLPASHPELIPIALAVVLFSVLFDPRISVFAAMVLAVLIGGQSVFRGTNALFVSLIAGVAAAFSVRTIRRRNQAYYSMATVAGAYALAAVVIGLTLGWSPEEMARSAGFGALNAIVAISLAMVLLPPAEEFTGIETYLKLLEWSDLNRPLMQRLSLEAPGTYAHTIAIANLAESACNAIGANGLLARVGAYYHDIGKLKKPQYFVENQSRGRNPHDKLKPSTSASIIRNHVREGMELAEEYKLPKSVRAFITEHHGTAQISYFLEKARERDGAAGLNASEFTYPGPVPRSAETAIVMLADGVEASVRVLHDPTPQRIREVIDHIVRQRMDHGQLRDAPLTLRQLETAKEQFARVLMGMHHARIDYPASSGGVTSEFASV